MTMTMFSCRAVLLAAAATCAFAAQAEDAPIAAPPRAEPLTETVHGITLADEYRWMEDPANRDAMIAFIAQENARTRTKLDALPERAWFEQRLGEISSNLDRIGNYMRCGDIALLSRTGAGDRLAKLYLRDAQGERLFLDPAVVAGDELASFGAVEFAPDCRRVSVQVSSGGAEAGRVLLFDIPSIGSLAPGSAAIWV